MVFRVERSVAGGGLAVGLFIALAGTGCDQLIARLGVPVVSPTPGLPVSSVTPTPGPRTLGLAPETLRLNVPSSEPCPCPFESTASLVVGATAGLPLRWAVSDDAVATVSAEGVVTARATGTTIVTVEANGWLSSTASVDVVDQGGRASVVLQ